MTDYTAIAAEVHALSAASGKWAAQPSFERVAVEMHAKLARLMAGIDEREVEVIILRLGEAE